MLLIDRLWPMLDKLTAQHPKERDKLWQARALSQAVAFRIDNVASCIRAMGQDRKLPQQAYPNVAPLAPVMWFEFDGPAIGAPMEYSYGCLITAVDMDTEQGQKYRHPEFPSDARFALRAEYFYSFGALDSAIQDKPGQVAIRYPHWEYLILVRSDGSICKKYPLPNPIILAMSIEPEQDNKDAWHEPIEFSLAAICFAHCKGVSITDKQQPRQQRRAAERSGHRPLVTYKILDIGPATRLLRDEGRVEQVGLERALHIVRAHFAHYEQDKPLFGKYTGTFYIPMHVRGNAAHGIALKDYNIVTKL